MVIFISRLQCVMLLLRGKEDVYTVLSIVGFEDIGDCSENGRGHKFLIYAWQT